MIIIGERINTSRKDIAHAVKARAAKFIKLEATKQANSGADFIDVNCGTNINSEIEDLKWVAQVVQSEVNLPLCIDSPDPKAIEAVLAVHKGKAFVNSITAEKQRAEAILPLVKKYDCFVIGLAMGDNGVPVTAEERKEAAAQILKYADSFGINKEKLYIDAVVQPVATDFKQGNEFLKAIGMIKTSLGLKTIAGLSNISFGLPKRSILNASFFAMAVCSGLDAAIVDIINPNIYATLRATHTLSGEDQFCQKYLSAFRKGRLK